jgi:hypothetical protein
MHTTVKVHNNIKTTVSDLPGPSSGSTVIVKNYCLTHWSLVCRRTAGNSSV